MANKNREEVKTLTPAQKIQFDIIAAISEPKIAAGFIADVTELEAALERWSRESDTRITMNTAVIKAVTLTLQKYPTLGMMPRGYKLIKPGSIDIGVSVAGAEILAPVVVIKEAETKSLVDIAREVRVRSEEARRTEAENMEKVSRMARWFPFDGLRRWIIHRLVRSQRVRHQAAGCFQISNVSTIGVDWVTTGTASNTLIMIGRRGKAPVVLNDKIEVRSIQNLTIIGDHRTLNGVTGGEFVLEIQRILEHPEALIKGDKG